MEEHLQIRSRILKLKPFRQSNSGEVSMVFLDLIEKGFTEPEDQFIKRRKCHTDADQDVGLDKIKHVLHPYLDDVSISNVSFSRIPHM